MAVVLKSCRCKICGESAEQINVHGIDITSCPCVDRLGHNVSAVLFKDVDREQAVNLLSKVTPTPLTEDNLRRAAELLREAPAPVGLSEFLPDPERDRLVMRKECMDQAIAECRATFDKTYGETIENQANEIERLKAEITQLRRPREPSVVVDMDWD